MATTKVTSGGVKDGELTNADLHSSANIASSKLADSGVSAGSYGSATAVPALTINAKGQVTAASTNNISIPAAITINNQADNRIITASGTTNTLNAESNVHIDGSGQLGVGTASPGQLLSLNASSGQCQQSLASATNQSCAIYFGDTDSVNRSVIKHDNANDSLAFNTAATERMRLTSSGEVGINLTDPEAYGANGNGYAGLTVEAPSGNYSGITIRSNYAGAGSLQFADGSGSTAERRNGFIDCDHVNKRLNIGIEGSSKIRITENGFHPNPGDYAADNALDDYEEGTWTPSNSTVGATSGADIYGAYTKIGNMVIATGIYQFASNGSGINVHVDGLPFTAASGPSGGSYWQGGFLNYTNQGGTYSCLISGASTRFFLYTPSGGQVALTNFDDKHIRFTLIYRV